MIITLNYQQLSNSECRVENVVVVLVVVVVEYNSGGA